MRFIAQVLGVVSICFAAGCVSSNIRLPASFKPKYNNSTVELLKAAAKNGIVFQVSDTVFRDVPARQVDRCRKADAPTWSAMLTDLLTMLKEKDKEAYYNKFHIVDIKRGDKARAEISEDLSHVTYLTITYAKRETREKMTSTTTVPCYDSGTDYEGKDLITTNIDWPNIEEMKLALKQAPNKKDVPSFQFNTDFLTFLAERQAILKIGPEVPYAKSKDAEPYLKLWLEKMATEIKEPNNIEYISYWLKEINTHSRQASSIQFFGLYREGDAAHGVQVDTVGKYSRKLNSYQEPTYMFMSYGEVGGDTVTDDLKDLNACLRTLTGIYSNPLAMGTQLEADGDSFLSPGYSCKIERKH
ncbi:MAG: hypothetical protein JSU04_03820 [Bdellovibrionales bacterium]|nr:hypothetical protein [Bdellovibrionales bacterium]